MEGEVQVRVDQRAGGKFISLARLRAVWCFPSLLELRLRLRALARPMHVAVDCLAIEYVKLRMQDVIHPFPFADMRT